MNKNFARGHNDSHSCLKGVFPNGFSIEGKTQYSLIQTIIHFVENTPNDHSIVNGLLGYFSFSGQGDTYPLNQVLPLITKYDNLKFEESVNEIKTTIEKNTEHVKHKNFHKIVDCCFGWDK